MNPISINPEISVWQWHSYMRINDKLTTILHMMIEKGKGSVIYLIIPGIFVCLTVEYTSWEQLM